MPIDDLTALGQKIREARKKKRPDTTRTCRSESCICKADRQNRKRGNKPILFDFEGIGKGAAAISGHSDQSRCFSRR